VLFFGAWKVGILGLLTTSIQNHRARLRLCLLMFIGSAHPNLCSGIGALPVRHFRQEEHHWTLSPNKRQRTPYGLARELDANWKNSLVPPFRSHLPEAHISLKPTSKTSAQNAIEKINNPCSQAPVGFALCGVTRPHKNVGVGRFPLR